MQRSQDSCQSSSTENFENVQNVQQESTSDFAKRIFKMLGRPIPGKANYIFKAVFFSHFLLIAQITTVLIFKWDDFALRSKAIENFNLEVLSVSTLIELAFYPEKIESFVKIINKPIYEYKYQLSKKQKECKQAVIAEDNSLQKHFNGIITYYYIVVHLLPFVYTLVSVLLTNSDCCEEVHLNYVYWLPFPLKSILIYSFLAILHNVCALTMSAAYVGWFVLFMSALQHIGQEIDILCLFIEEIDERLNQNYLSLTENESTQLQIQNDNIDYYNKTSQTLKIEDENELKIYLREIIQHHLVITQSVEEVNRSTSVMMYIYNQFCCIELCINLYLAYVVTDIKRYNYFTTFFLVMALVGLIGNTGQKLINKGEKLYRVITESSWINKPAWFKKSIYVMIIHAIKPLQIKPLNLYVMNLGNTMKIGQAAYSYFNLLRSLKEK